MIAKKGQRAFVDSNIWLYSFLQGDPQKTTAAADWERLRERVRKGPGVNP